jgi:prepilin-type N-terminal cleavage/methylation domain-containing protein
MADEGASEHEAGYTLMEVMVCVAVLGVLLGIGLPNWSRYQANQDFLSSVRTTVSVLREAQTQAVSEQTTYRVDVVSSGKGLETRRFAGSAFVRLKLHTLPGSAAQLTAPAFTRRDGSLGTSVYFLPARTASDGTVRLTKVGTTRSRTINVEGLTGRVKEQ